MSDEITLTIDEGDTIQEPSTDIFSSDDIRQEIVDYLGRELEEVSADAGRSVRMTRNEKIKRQRLAQPESESKDFPWENASNVSTPLALQKTNIVATKLLSSFMSKKPLFTFTSYDPKYKQHAEAVTRHIQKQVESPYGINLYRKLWNIVYSTTSLGTSFVKVPFTVDQMKFNRLSDTGGIETVDRLVRATPEVVSIAFEDFLTRSHWSDIQKAPWIAIKHKLYSHELRRLAQQGYYSDVENVLNEPSTLDEHKIADLSNLGVEESGSQDTHNYEYFVYECYVRWDADGDGFDEDIILHLDLESKTILRVEYNELGIRPVLRIPYIDIPDQLYALGVGDIVSSLQDEADTLHNMRNDSTQLSIMPWVVSSESSSFGQSMDLYPGKVLKAAVPREDIIIHKFPSIGPDALTAESQVQQLADDATGASQALAGQDVGGYNRIGAQGTQFLASQSNGYLDSIATQMGFALGEMGLLVLYQNVKNSDFLNLDMLSESDRMRCNEVYSMNVEDIPGTFQFIAKLSAIADSRSSKQQEALAVYQVYTAYIDKMIQLGASLANPQFAQIPQVQETISTAYVGLTQMMKDVLEKYDEENVGDYLPFILDIEQQLRIADEQREAQVEAIDTELIGQEDQGAVENTVPDDGTGSGGVNNPQGPGAGNLQGPTEVPADEGDTELEPI